MRNRFFYPLLLLLWAIPSPAQTPVPDPPGWFTVGAAGTYLSTSEQIFLPGGTVYRFGGTTPAGVTAYCDPNTVPTGLPAGGITLLVWLPANCTVTTNGVTVPVADIAPYGSHFLEIQEVAGAEQVLNVTPAGMAASTPVTVPALPGGTTTTAPTNFTCGGPLGSGVVISISGFAFVTPTAAAPATNVQGIVKIGGATLSCSNLAPDPSVAGAADVTCIVPPITNAPVPAAAPTPATKAAQ